MSKQLVLVILVNVILALLFILANTTYWSMLNGNVSFITPTLITVKPTAESLAGMPNFPFELFWISMIINLIFILWIQRSKKDR